MYQCKICGKELQSKQSYVRHELAHRVTFKCETCGKLYRRQTSLREHQKKTQHGNERRCSNIYTCSSCKATFATVRNLVDHNNKVHQNQQIGGATESSLNGTAEVKTLRPEGQDRFDLVAFLARAKTAIEKYLLSKVRKNAIKWYIVAQVELSRETADGEIRTVQPFFRSINYTLLTVDNFESHDLNAALQKIVIGLEKYIHESSGWILERVILLNIHTIRYKPLGGSSFIDLPTTLKQSGAILNIKNNDNRCFLWAMLAGLYGPTDRPEEVEYYKPFETNLDMGGISFPVSLASLNRFENQNDGLSVNIFGFENNEIYPLRITKLKGKKHINLLFLQEGNLSHFCLITDLNRFLSRTKSAKTKSFFCWYCLCSFTRQDLLNKHIVYCSVNGEQKIELPEKGKNDVLKFTDFRKQMLIPFVIYCDFETLNRDIFTCSPDPDKSSTTSKKHLEVCSYGYKRICTVDDRFTKETVIYRGSNASEHFIESLLEEEKEIRQILSETEPLKMTDKDREDFRKATHCFICEKPFEVNENNKVLDHCHVSGKYRGAACGSCNLNFQICSFIPCFFHGFRNFDSHIICESIGKYEENRKEIKCIPQNMERYISFSLGNLRFLDSYQFLSSSLDCLTENLKANGGLNKFRYFLSEFNDEETAELLLRKNVYPYDYMTNEEKFLEREIPSKEAFYSSVKNSDISEDDYNHALKVFKTLKLCSLGEYSDIYLKTDVLLLCDIFENFRKVSHDNFRLDPAHFYSSPGLSFSAMLKMTKVELELLTNVEDLQLWERGIRGGISYIGDRYAEANNPYLKSYDVSKPTSYIGFLDANNLYGWACQAPLPVGGFRRLSLAEIQGFNIMAIPDDAEKGYLIEASLSYPDYLHDEHNCFPLGPVKRSINNNELSEYAKDTWKQLRGKSKRPKNEKLLCTLEDKDFYVLHYRNLKLYLRLGLRIKQIHSILEFKQQTWLKPYIDFNTQKRKEAKTEFEKSFYKILNCSVFGKLMQCQRKHIDVTLTSCEKKVNKLTAKPSFKECRIFNENLVGVHCKRVKVRISKPVYVGQTILDLSKLMMYEFWYGYLKKKYSNQCRLLCTDTDSFVFEVLTKDFYGCLKKDAHHFDFSDYPKDSPLFSLKNKKVPGKFKDELNGKVIKRFCGLRSKMYALVYEESEADKERKKAKGVAKATIDKTLRFDMYKSALFDRTEFLSSMELIRSHSHIIYCETVRKKSLSAFDDKRFLLNNGLSSLAYGHYIIKSEMM